jgi:hypothetical protein
MPDSITVVLCQSRSRHSIHVACSDVPSRQEQVYGHHQTQLYALGIGFGADPSDEAQLAFVYEGVVGRSLKVVPTMANIPAYLGFWAREPDTGIESPARACCARSPVVSADEH